MRRRLSRWRARRWCPRRTGPWTPCTAVWVCWGPLGWTIRELLPVLLRLPFILAKFWVPDDRASATEFVDGRVERGTRTDPSHRRVRRGTRLLRAARRRQERQRCRHQARLSQAGARAASRYQPR